MVERSDPVRVVRVRSERDLGLALREARRSRGLTQADLAEQIGIERAYLAALEAGRSTRLVGHLLRSFRRLGVNVTISWDVSDRRSESSDD